MASGAFDGEHHARSGFTPKLGQLLELGSLEHRPQLGHIGEFDNHDPIRRPFAIKDFDALGPHDESAAVAFNHGNGLTAKLLEGRLVRDLVLTDQIGSHLVLLFQVNRATVPHSRQAIGGMRSGSA